MNMEKLALAGIDVKELLDRFLNNTELVRMVIGKFLEDPIWLQLKDAVVRQDLQAAEFACHSLKSICGNLSLKRLFPLLQEQFRLFRSGQSEAACAMTEQICAEYEAALAHLQAWMACQ